MSEKPARGGCLCGAVRFEVRPPYLRLVCCHCSRCRKATSASHATNLVLEPDGLRWLDGEALVERFDLPEARSFATAVCRRCGTPLPHATRSGREVIVPAGSLDESPGISPSGHAHLDSRAPWLAAPVYPGE